MIETYDTTLRDGEQREGISLSLHDKLAIARKLDTLGISYIEGGFPGSNPKDAAFFEELRARPLEHAVPVAFGATVHKDCAAEEDENLAALASCGAPAVAVVGKAWLLHVSEVLETTPEENLRMIGDSIRFLKQSGLVVFFDAEHFFDGYKSDAAYALKVLKTALDAGAGTLVLCETNGGAMPHEVFETVTAVCDALPKARIGIHTHDDCGVAVACALEAVRAGAILVQGTVNGYGERVGNADLSVLIPDLELKCGLETIGPERMSLLSETASYVAEVANIALDSHHPFVGSSAFAHKAGLHASAVNKISAAYEHVDPSLVGNFSHIVVSQLAGRSSLERKAAELDVDIEGDGDVISSSLDRIKENESSGYSYELADASLALLLMEEAGTPVRHFMLESFRVIADKREDGRVMTEATIKIHVGDERFVATGEGNGPVNALDTALRMAITRFYPQIENIELTDFKVRVLDGSLGTDAVTRVLIESSDGAKRWGTVGVSENIIEASWDALVDAIEYGLLRTGTSPER